MWSTLGHEHVKDILDKQLKSGQFPHAYFFAGPEGVGKKTLALEFAQKILGAGDLAAHPDFLLLDRQGGEITMDAVQEFMERLSLKPFMGAWKVAVVNNAEQLNTQSGNALLKTLEEPSPSTVIILVSSNAFLLPTIVSRCQEFAFNALPDAVLREFAARRRFSAGDDLIAASFGRIGRLAAFAGHGEAYQQQLQNLRLLDDLRNMPAAERLLRIPELAELENGDLKALCSTWLLGLKARLGVEPQLYAQARPLYAALRQLDTNKNKKLILQGLFLAL